MTPYQYRAIRRACDLTQGQLALVLGLPREAVVRREAGTQNITVEAVLALGAVEKWRVRKPRNDISALPRKDS